MRFARFGVGAAVLFLVSTALGQQPSPTSPRDLIVGEWVMSEKKDDTEIKATFVFTKDHKAMATLSFKMGKEEEKKVTINATYDWVGMSDDTIEMTTRPPGAKEDADRKG